MQAYAKGKTIEICCDSGATWVTDDNPSFNPEYAYRVKPESKCRPFENREECWEEMQKHQPFGWIMDRDKNYTSISSMNNRRDFSYMFNNFIFADGLPFGIKE